MKENKFALLNTVLLAVMIVLQVVTMIVLFPKQEAAVTPGKDNTSADNGSQGVIKVDVLNIDTPYGTMQYPAKWLDSLKHRENKGADFYSNTFVGHISGQDTELFTVHFGQPQKGELKGYIDKNGQKVSFTIEKANVDRNKWSEEDYNTILAMQDDVKVLIDSVNLV